MAKSTRSTGKNPNKTRAKLVYLDHASSAISAESNPSAIHELGLKQKIKLENARKSIAQILGANTNEITFTSGATESNNLVILGLVQNFSNPHIVTTNIEHSSVLEVFKYLEKTKKADVTFVEVEPNGIVDPKKIKKALRKETVLVSVMYANNEIGTVQPIREIAKEIRHFTKFNSVKNKIYFHTDATQAMNYLPIRVESLGVDAMSFNAAKIYGPKGVGALYVKRGTPVTAITFGGDQESGIRPGTENVEGVVALRGALELVESIKLKEVARLKALQTYFFKKLKTLDKNLIINGDLENRLPNNINITIPNIPSDLLVIELSVKGVMASAKSACKSGDGKASYVIEAINKKIKDTDGSIRFSLGKDTTKKDIDYALLSLSSILKKLKKWYD
ncbi:cysteine desulfurase [Patescibacteria group bacterium]|nr:cysteine desulfurase [Patescibacteria group bacterium]